jgi:hypothetical protein
VLNAFSIPREATAQVMSDGYARFRSTPYQDPIILGAILATMWDDVWRAYRDMGFKTAAPDTVAVGTIPLAVLNGFVISEGPSHAIVLQEGLRFLPTVFAHFVSNYLFYEDEKSLHVMLDPDLAVALVKSKPDAPRSFIGSLLRDAAGAGILALGAEASRKLWSSPARTRAVTMIEAGFKAFLLAHEASHCLRRHGLQLDTSVIEVHRSPDSLAKVQQAWRARYSDRPEPDEDQAYRYRVLQAMEMQADADAIAVVVNICQVRSHGDDTFNLLLVGALLFFWYLELTERILRVLDHGDDWFEDPLFTHDFEVQDYMLRTSHPSPISRVRHVGSVAYQQLGEGSDLPPFINSAWAVLSALFEEVWADNREAVCDIVTRGGLTRGSKWLETPPAFLSHCFGVDYRGTSR